MAVAPRPQRGPELKRPRIRLRTLLGGLLLVGGTWWATPRAMSAVELHDSATTLADYALCMVGPTGAGLVRDNPTELRRLVRRRLIGALPEERPFAKCSKAAAKLTDSSEVERAHQAAASSFVEYGGGARDRAAAGSRVELTLQSLVVTSARLSTLARRAWPFAMDGYTQLIKPSISAFEAVHPVALARPSPGRGLPGYAAEYRAVRVTERGWFAAFGRGAHLLAVKSSDGGVTWTQVSPYTPSISAFTEHCPAGDGRAYTLGTSDDNRVLTVTSLGPDSAPFVAALARSELEIVAASCDETALVAALAREHSREIGLRLCRYRQACVDLAAPPMPGVGKSLYSPLDLARIKGVTVVALNMHGLVRVASSRDDGRSWTPYTVAFDPEAYPELGADVPVPDRMLVAGSRLLLYGAARKPAQTYPLLFSDDFGASWRTPRPDLRVARGSPATE